LSRRVLITGGAGQLATDLAQALDVAGDQVRRLDRLALDITDRAAVERELEATRPELAFNCAAFHNVDACEAEEATAARVNFRAVKGLAESCAGVGCKLIHFSTNYVFDGSAERPYAESDAPSPRSVYAITKLAGEYAALAYAPSALVVRSAGLYGAAGSESKGGNFVERMLARAESGEAIRMVADQRLTPTFTGDLAAAVIEAVGREASGILHLTNSGACSWHEFTLAILDLAGVEARVEPVNTVRQAGAADRPLNGVLASERADALGLAPLRQWREALAAYLELGSRMSAATRR
jgi:dTDP-4-dehydrorhamnose reductase